MVVTVESLAQVILSRGRGEWRAGLHAQAGIKIGLYVVYILFFGVLSSLSFFVSRVSLAEQVTEQINRRESFKLQQWEQNNRLIETLTGSLAVETATGYGSRSKEIYANLEALKAAQKELEADLREAVTSSSTNGAVNIFGLMAEVIGIPANVLKLTSFGVLTMFVFAGLVILNPSVHVTGEVTARNIKRCPICNSPLRPGQKYCSNACKQKAYRERRREYDRQEMRLST